MTNSDKSEDIQDGINQFDQEQGERPPRSRMAAARERAAAAKNRAVVAKERTLATTGEQLQDSIEPGRAEKAGPLAIDALAKGATMGLPLIPLPLETELSVP
jgi:hypothetical protein